MSALAAGHTGCGSASRQVVPAWWPQPARLSQTQPTFRGNLKSANQHSADPNYSEEVKYGMAFFLEFPQS